MRTRKTLACLAAMSALGALIGTSTAAELQSAAINSLQPIPTDGTTVSPISGQNAPEEFKRNSLDRKFTLPHPPLDQIPMMPMPEPPAPGVTLGTGDVSMTFHDAATGETRKLPISSQSTNAIGGQSPDGDYPGFGNMIDNSDEVSRAFGVMSLAGGLDTWPRSGNVKLIMRFTDTGGTQRWFACSGSMQDPGVVLAAAHCIYARTPNGLVINDWADIIYVYPAWDGDNNNGPFGAPDSDEIIQNFGFASGTAYIAGSDYVNNGNFDRDCGVIRLTRGSSRNIGMLTGWYAWAWGSSCATIQSRTYNNFSYPSENCPTAGLHNGRDMYYWAGSIDDCPNNQMQLNTGGNCLDTVWGGMSGSGMYYIDGDNRYVHSVASTSNRNDRGYYCKLWEQFVIDMQAFETTTRGTALDIEPLRFRTSGSNTVYQGQAFDGNANVSMVNATNNNPATDTYQIKVYLSTNNNISTADTLLATWNYNVDFAAMQTFNFSVPAPVIPLGTPPGDYFMGIILDTGADSNSTNNDTDTWDAQAVTVLEANADLNAVLSDATSGTYYQGETINVLHRTENVGTRVTGDVHLEFRASTNTIISTFDTLMEERNYGPVAIGGQIFVNSLVDIPSDLPPGNYYIGTIVDENSGSEVVTGNNSIADTATITVIECLPDMNGDATLNFFDVSAFLSLFNAMDPQADFNNDGSFNFFDVSAFLSAYSAGCP